MKKVMSICIGIMTHLCAFAGGLMTNTNQSASFLRDFARGTTLDADAVYYNPAGSVFMTDGWHMSFNNQQVIQSRTIESTFPLFANNQNYLGKTTRKFKGKTFAQIVPSIYAVYKKDRWAGMASLSVAGGGGTVEFEDGLGSFESIIGSAVAGNVSSAAHYNVDMYFKGTSITGSLQLGAAYRINDWLSAAVQLRTNYSYYKYKGWLKDVKAIVGGNSIPLMADMNLRARQTGLALTEVLALGFNKSGWSGSLKYEFKCPMTVENHTASSVMGMFPDGAEEKAEIPAMLEAAVGRQFGAFKATVEYHHFFDKDAKNSFSKVVDGDTNEYLFGLEWAMNDKIDLSTSCQRSAYQLDEANYSDMNYNTSSTSIGVGGAYRFNEKFRLTLGCMYSIYDKATRESSVYNASAAVLPGKDIYSRHNFGYAVGLEINF